MVRPLVPPFDPYLSRSSVLEPAIIILDQSDFMELTLIIYQSDDGISIAPDSSSSHSPFT